MKKRAASGKSTSCWRLSFWLFSIGFRIITALFHSMSVHNGFMLWTLILLFNFIRFVRGEQVLCLLTFCLKRISLWEYTPHLRPSECWLCSFSHLMTVVLSNRQNDNR